MQSMSYVVDVIVICREEHSKFVLLLIACFLIINGMHLYDGRP